MDYVGEDVSARIILKNVLHTEPSVSPVTSTSASQDPPQSPGSKIRGSIRRRSNVMALTPQEALKQSMRKKLRECTSRSSLQTPPSKRRTMSEGVRKRNSVAPATNSVLYDNDITPRHLLKGILQTEPETSLLIQDRPVRKESEQPYANSSVVSNNSSEELSELDLPDMTTTVMPGNTVKGLKRKRPRRSLNVKAFEYGEDSLPPSGGDDGCSVTEDLSSLSSASPSSVTFSLKTPFVDLRTEKKAFKRKAPNRKIMTVEEFDEALQNQQGTMSGDTEMVHHGLSETDPTLIVGPDITLDIFTNQTALYALPMSTSATMDQNNSPATPIQTKMGFGGQKQDEKMVLDGKNGEELITDSGKREDSVRQEDFKSQTMEVVAESQTEEEEVAESQTEEEVVAESQTGEEEVGVSQTGEEEVAESQTGEEEVAESQTGEEEVAESQTGEEEVAESQTEEEEVAESQTEEEEVAESQTEEEEVAESQTEEEEVAESQMEEEEVAESQTGEEEVAESQTGEEEVAGWKLQQSAFNAVHVSKRDYQSEGGVNIPGIMAGGRGSKSLGAELLPSETGWSGRRSDGTDSGEWHSGPQVVASGSTDPQTVNIGSPPLFPPGDELEGSIRTALSPSNEGKENSKPSLETADGPENNTLQSSTLSVHPITTQSPVAHEEDWEDVEEEHSNQSEELSMKTPAFVREKKNILSVDLLNTPTVFKDLQPSVQAGAAVTRKPKAVRGKQTGSKKDQGLPKSYVMTVFKHFAKTKVSPDVYPVLKEIMERYFDRLAEDLETYAAHAKRKTIEVEDVVLLMKRQGFVSDSMPVNVLIEKYLPMESRKLLIPVASSGNYVIPKLRRK